MTRDPTTSFKCWSSLLSYIGIGKVTDCERFSKLHSAGISTPLDAYDHLIRRTSGSPIGSSAGNALPEDHPRKISAEISS